MTELRRVGGWIPDPHDLDDRPFLRLRATMPLSTVTTRAFLPFTSRVSNQGPIGSCVANSACDSYELLAGRPDDIIVVHSLAEALSFLVDAIPEPEQLSRLDLYFKSRASHDAECEDEGTHIRSAFKVFARLGVTLERLWPYKVENVFVRPPLDALQEGYDHKIAGYYKITSRGAQREFDIRAAIDNGYPVVLGMDVSKDFLSYDKGEHVVFEPPEDNIAGGHAMAVVGYEQLLSGDFKYLLRNSWGASWGLRSCPGHVWVSRAYIARASDLWVATLPVR